jgi:hypothetical protein
LAERRKSGIFPGRRRSVAVVATVVAVVVAAGGVTTGTAAGGGFGADSAGPIANASLRNL